MISFKNAQKIYFFLLLMLMMQSDTHAYDMINEIFSNICPCFCKQSTSGVIPYSKSTDLTDDSSFHSISKSSAGNYSSTLESEERVGNSFFESSHNFENKNYLILHDCTDITEIPTIFLKNLIHIELNSIHIDRINRSHLEQILTDLPKLRTFYLYTHDSNQEVIEHLKYLKEMAKENGVLMSTKKWSGGNNDSDKEDDSDKASAGKKLSAINEQEENDSYYN